MTRGAGATIDGTVETGAQLTPLQHLQWSVDYPSSTQDLSVATNATAALSPGAYRTVTVFPHGNLTLSSGTYFIDAMHLMATAHVVADTSAGPVFVYIGTTADLGAPILPSTGAPSDRLLLGYFGAGAMTIAAPFAGTVVAPNSTVTIGTGASRGSFFASQIRFNSSASVTFEAFSAWDLIFPPKPIVHCVAHFDGNHSTTVWGYENVIDIPIHVPIGPRNNVAPLDDRLITDFEPGRHDKVFLSFFGGAQNTWSLGNTSVSSDAVSTSRCGVGDLPTAPSPDQLIDFAFHPGTSPPQSQLALNVTTTNNEGTTIHDSLPARTPPGPPPAPPPAGSGFQFVIDGQDLDGDDALCGPRQLSVNVFIDGVNDEGRPRNLPGCTNPEACGVPVPNEAYNRSIPAGQSVVTVFVHVDERDTGPCGGDDDKILEATLSFDPLTGAMVGGSLTSFDSDDDPLSPTVLPPDTHHIVGRDDFGIFFDTHVTVATAPKFCGKWRANFIDSGSAPGFAGTEDFLTSKDPEPIPAAFARAHLLVRPTSTVIPFNWVGVLDKDGCVPAGAMPDFDLLRATPELVVRLDLYSYIQACFERPDGSCDQTVTDLDGARVQIDMAETPSLGNAPRHTWQVCKAFSASDLLPDCQVATGLPGWTSDGNPPAQLDFMNDAMFEITRASAVMSHMFQQEASGNILGLRSALQPASGPARVTYIHLNTTTCYAPLADQNFPMCDQVNSTADIQACDDRGQCDTSGGGSGLNIGPDKTGPNGETIPGDSNWKFVIAHEFGHVLQALTFGLGFPNYDTFRSTDLPPKCACDHVVVGGNSLHCLQSMEGPGAAQHEGWGQFFSSRVWNRPTDADCTFKYYKEFLNDGQMPGVPAEECHPFGNLVSCRPPIPIDCLAPVRWRNNQCFDSTVTADQIVTLGGTEYDWMGFYYSTSVAAASPITIDDFGGIYRTACGGQCGIEIPWDGTCAAPPCVPAPPSLVEAASTYLGVSPKLNAFNRAGVQYGVSRDVTR